MGEGSMTKSEKDLQDLGYALLEELVTQKEYDEQKAEILGVDILEEYDAEMANKSLQGDTYE